MFSPHGEVLEQALRLGFTATNNEAEYEALIFGIWASYLEKVRDLLDPLKSYKVIQIPRD